MASQQRGIGPMPIIAILPGLLWRKGRKPTLSWGCRSHNGLSLGLLLGVWALLRMRKS